MSTQEELKKYLERVLSLRPAKNLSATAFFIFKLGKEILNDIGGEAGFIGDRERYLKYFYSLKLNRLPTEESKVLDIILEGLEWIKENSTLWKWKSDECKSGISEKLHGDEIFWAFEFAMMTDEQLKAPANLDALMRLSSIDIKPKEEIEDHKWYPISDEELEEKNKILKKRYKESKDWERWKRIAKEAGSDFFDNVTEETLNDIKENCEWLDETFPEFLAAEKELKEQIRLVYSDDSKEEQWKLLLKVYFQLEEAEGGPQVKNVIKLLPYLSDLKMEGYDLLKFKIRRFEPAIVCLLCNLGGDECGEDEEGWFWIWWD